MIVMKKNCIKKIFFYVYEFCLKTKKKTEIFPSENDTIIIL